MKPFLLGALLMLSGCATTAVDLCAGGGCVAVLYPDGSIGERPALYEMPAAFDWQPKLTLQYLPDGTPLLVPDD